MKTSTRKWLKAVTRGYAVAHTVNAQDVLDSDAKLRAEVADLKARLRAVRRGAEVALSSKNDQCDDAKCGWCLARRAVNLRVKNWGRP